MSFQKFKISSYCNGGKHKTAPRNIYVEITSKGSKVLIGYCSFCNREKWMIVSNNTILAERLSDVFKNLGKKGLNVSRKMTKIISKISEGALEIGANVGTEFAPRSPKAAPSSLLEMINFYHTGDGLYFGKFVCFYVI